MTAVDIDIRVPVLPGLENNEQNWASVCGFDALIPEEVKTDVLETVQKPTAFLHTRGHIPKDELLFRTRGLMEEAITETADTLGIVMGTLIMANLTEVFLINHIDAERALVEKRKPRGYNVTNTVLAILNERQ